MYDQFKTRAEAVSAEVHRFPTPAAALDFMVGFLQDEGLADAPHQQAVWADCPFLGTIDRQQLAGIKGLQFDVTRERAAEARFGISQMDWALADTGTLAQDATAVDKRLVSTLPAIHIALVATRALLPDLPAWLAQTQPKTSGYLSLITGPSRTADIERVLTIGVHGPERLIIIFVDELGGTN
jgi:L-lactate dehydrogenase complex protein LldG